MKGKVSQDTQKRLKELEAIVENIPDHVFIVSESGYIVGLYESEEDPFAVDIENYIGKHIRELYGREIAKFYLDCIDSAVCQDETLFLSYWFDLCEIEILPEELKTDQKLWFEARIKPLHLEESGERLLMWFARNITERRELEEELKQLVKKDELTNIYNRRAFLSKLTDEITRYKRYSNKPKLSLLIFDIDDFKHHNDELGHLGGDQVIKHICNVCADELRSCDYFGRIGGEEFAVILPQTDIAQAVVLAERLREAVEAIPCVFDDKAVSTTISIGIAEVQLSDSGPSDMLRRADSAMYASKKRGKNRVTILANCEPLAS